MVVSHAFCSLSLTVIRSKPVLVPLGSFPPRASSRSAHHLGFANFRWERERSLLLPSGLVSAPFCTIRSQSHPIYDFFSLSNFPWLSSSLYR